MNSFFNLDLLSVGITIAAIGILGFAVYFNNRHSVTTQTFLAFSLFTVLYGGSNYINYRVTDPALILILLRATIFFAVWHAFSFFQLFYVFPDDHVQFSKRYFFILVPFVVIVSALTLTPLVFSGLASIPVPGEVAVVQRGPGVLAFMLMAIFLVGGGIVMLIRKLRRAEGTARKQFTVVLVGVAITFTLLIIFNLVLPIAFENVRYVPLGALFMFPFIAFTFYAIRRHSLLHMKVISTEILTFVLALATLLQVLFSESAVVLVFRSGVFILVLAFGILLIKSVVREVEQREQLKIINDKLQVADRMKTQFLSFASHQVKSPMTVVKDYAELIRDGSYGIVPDKVKETAQKIHDSADRLIALVNNLLDLRRLEEGKIEYAFESVNVTELIKSIVDEMQPLAKEKNLELTADLPAQAITAKADKDKLRQVIQNLIDNSVKYTEAGWIKVKLYALSSTLKIEVSDSGMGISADVLPLLFEQFVRSSGETKKIQGTGLGLYIAKQFIKAHHGDITASSPGVGKGSVFTVELPYANSHH